MVAVSASRSESENSAAPTVAPPRKLNQCVRLVNTISRPSPRSSTMATTEQGTRARKLWHAARLWPSSPVLRKKNARVASTDTTVVSSNQHGSVSLSPRLFSRKKQQRNQQQQEKDENSKVVTSIDTSSTVPETDDCCSPRKHSANGEQQLDLSSSITKLSLSGLHVSSTEPSVDSFPTQSLAVNLLKRASLRQELLEFRANGDAQITMFPDYFNDEEKGMVQAVAQELRLGCQVGEKNIAIYKLLPPVQHSRARPGFTSSAGSRGNITGSMGDDVYVDVDELAQQGKDGFIARLRLRRLSSGSGVRRNMLWDVAELSATADGVADPVNEGEGGVYAVQSRSSGQKLALFKPAEEEKFVREGLCPGEGAVREEAAYVLDARSSGFSGVPPTAVARLRFSSLGRAKQGAVQRFMTSSIGSMDGFGMPFDLAEARAFVPVEQVHRIALLDVRVFNTDRHPGNILLIGEKKSYTMVPIDHGCILPSWFRLSEARFDWLEYPQSHVQFSTAELQYIAALDAERDAMVLHALGIREECVTTLKICTLFLQLAAARGKTLHWMGTFMVRAGCFQQPSPLELTLQLACERVGIPYVFEANEFDEQRAQITLGVLSRRPPAELFTALELLLLEKMDSPDGAKD